MTLTLLRYRAALPHIAGRQELVQNDEALRAVGSHARIGAKTLVELFASRFLWKPLDIGDQTRLC
jgi:hypothetical protein